MMSKTQAMQEIAQEIIGELGICWGTLVLFLGTLLGAGIAIMWWKE